MRAAELAQIAAVDADTAVVWPAEVAASGAGRGRASRRVAGYLAASSWALAAA